MRLVVELYTKDTTMFDSMRYVLNDTVVSMAYNEAKFEGDRHYVDVTYSNGKEHRIFNIDSVLFG